MSVLLITYDLRRPVQDYPDLLRYVKSMPWARLSESCYAVRTGISPDSICANLRQFIDGNDQVYVVTLRQPYSGFGPADVNNWLDQCLPAA